MVFVSMRQDDAPYFALVFNKIRKIGNDDIDTVHVVVGETKPTVNDEDVAAVLIDGEIFTDLVESAQRYDFQFFCIKRMFSLFVLLYVVVFSTQKQQPKGRRRSRP